MKEQLLLVDLGPLPPKPNKQKWTKLYKKYCEKIYDERGGNTGEYCCGYHWCCDECYGTLQNGCSDCVHTIKQIAKELGIEIDYNNFDFEKIEKEIEKAYERSRIKK